MGNTIRSEDTPEYAPTSISEADEKIIQRALKLVEGSLRVPGACLDSPDKTATWLKLKLARLEHEEFYCLFLDNRHRVITIERLFTGTIDGASVHPREVAKAALKHNAAALILAHNHPSGLPEPSRADTALTKRLVDAMGLIDVRVLDHVIIGRTQHTSMAERGLI